MDKKPNSNIAIVCDWLYGGGAEKVVLELHRMYPQAPIYTSYCSPEWRAKLDGVVRTGYLQWWPFARARKFLPLLRQWWFRQLNLSAFDIVISCTGNGEAKFLRTRSDATHICYCFTPPHFYWRKYSEYIKNPGMGALNGMARAGLKLLVKPLRRRDYQAAQRVDQFVAISKHIQTDIKTFYGQASTIIHPPVDIARFAASKTERHPHNLRCIVWGRHVPYKRLDLAIAACNELELPLTVIGHGPETKRLSAIAGPTVTFTGFVPDKKLPELAARASVFVFPSEEDFGIAPVEAMALGLPILAYNSGGALDYVVPGKTGELFDTQSVTSLVSVLQSFDSNHYAQSTLAKQAAGFAPKNFRHKLMATIERTTP